MQLQETLTTPKVYIGLDIHKKSWSVTIRTDIAAHKTMSVVPDAEQLYQYVERRFPNHHTRITYEAGCCGFSAARYFAFVGWDVCVVNPADVPTMHKQLFQKTDSNDSRNLCKQLEMNNLQAIHIPTEQQEQFRSLLRHRMQVAKDFRKIKTQIKAKLLFHGIKIPQQHDNSHWTKDFVSWVSNLQWSDPCGKSVFAHQIERRILAVIKKGEPYKANHNLLIDTKLELPTEATEIINEQLQEELDYKTGVAVNDASPSL